MIRTEAWPGETREEFIARIVATAHPLPDDRRALIRRLLPPVRRQQVGDSPSETR